MTYREYLAGVMEKYDMPRQTEDALARLCDRQRERIHKLRDDIAALAVASKNLRDELSTVEWMRSQPLVDAVKILDTRLAQYGKSNS